MNISIRREGGEVWNGQRKKKSLSCHLSEYVDIVSSLSGHDGTRVRVYVDVCVWENLLA